MEETCEHCEQIANHHCEKCDVYYCDDCSVWHHHGLPLGNSPKQVAYV